MDPALETRGLRRVFGDLAAVEGIDLAVPRGSFYGFLGPNGAGKSTTIHCLTGLLRSTAGRIRILGCIGQVHGLDAAAIRSRSAELLELMDLRQAAGDLVADYSHGMRKKIALAVACSPRRGFCFGFLLLLRLGSAGALGPLGLLGGWLAGPGV
ncbi:MAG: ATP-binding cassette domain-containing protein [Acidobacteria bacterium]|nr:ATP-binding cassette domain-containing protein [Acidobacteriota bacterium]